MDSTVDKVLEWTLPISSIIILVVVGIVLIVVYRRITEPQYPITVSKTVNGLLQTETLGNLILPRAGGFKGPGVAVNPWTNVLVFRSKSKTYSGGNYRGFFQLGSTDPSNVCVAATQCTPQARWEQVNNQSNGLYSFSAASTYNLPWPPEAGAQLAQQYQYPDQEPSASNPALPDKDGGHFQPSLANAFCKVTRQPSGNTVYNASRDAPAEQTLTRFEITFLQQGLVQVETAGGDGGPFWTGQEGFPNTVTYQGGRPGIVWAYVKVNKGDTWFVQVSQSGGSVPNTGNLKANLVNIQKNVTSTDAFNSGGGTGSFLSGSEGGGMSQASNQPWGASNGPVQGQRASGILIAAGGGGGASRNAFGGSAGSSQFTWKEPNARPQFGQSNPNQYLGGYPGGPNNVFDYKDVLPENQQKQTNERNQLSGGGASSKNMGNGYTSSDVSPVPASDRGLVVQETSGHFLQGGAGSNNPPGGGGGGAGFRGGGSGTWNFKRAPNNQHGAGGGGSSYLSSSTRFRSDQGYPCANPWQNSSGILDWPQAKAATMNLQNFQFEASNQFVVGIPMTQVHSYLNMTGS